MDPQLQERLMIYGGFIPGIISMLFLLTGWYLHAYKKSKRMIETDDHDEHTDRLFDGPRWILPLMLALGFIGADYASNYTIHLWHDSNNYRFTHAIALIALVAILEGLIRLPLLLAFALRALVYAGAFYMLAEGYTTTVLGGTPILIGSTIFAALISALIATSADSNCEHNHAQKSHSWVDAFTWLIISAGAMPILLKNSFSIGAMIPAGIIAVLTSTLIVSSIFKDLRFSRGGITVLVGFLMTMLVGSLIQTGAEYLPSLLLLGIAPLVTLIPLRSPSGLHRLIARVAILIVILGSSLATLHYATSANQSNDAEIDPYADYQTTP